MRIAIGQLWQESNTFNPCPTTRADFEQFGVSRGAAMVQQMGETNELGGFIQALKTWPERPEIVGLARLPAWPSGTITDATFDWLLSEILTALRAALPVDAVLLALHGAMVAQTHPDVEGEVLQAVRHLVGPQTPLVVTLDLHAALTPEMAAAADALVLYHSMPHVDIFETGQRGAAVLRRILIDRAQPTTAYQFIPCVLPAERANTEEPGSFAAERKGRLIELERDPRVLTAGIATAQPWIDIPQLGSAAIVTTDSDPPLARELCTQLAEELWRSRHQYIPELLTIEAAVRRAHECPAGLTVLSDAADATTSGAPGDSVWILQELLKYQWPGEVLVTVVAPNVVRQAAALGPGNGAEFELGGVRDTRFGTRLKVRATVERIVDGQFVLSGHIGRNLPIDMGRCAVLRSAGVSMIATERTGPHFAPELFQVAGFDPFSASVLVAKSPCGFRAAYAGRARQMFSVQAPGCAPSDFSKYPFHNIRRPLWPWDEIEGWEPDRPSSPLSAVSSNH